MVLLLLTASPAAAHGDAPTDAYHPLVLHFHGHLTAEGAVAQQAPEPGARAFPASAPLEAPPPLRFAFAAPVRFAPGGGFEVTLVVRADAALVARDAEGNALEFAIEAAGAPVEGASRRAPLGSGVLQPGETVVVRATLQAPGATFDEGAPLALVVRPLMPAMPEGALVVLVGGETPSRLDMPRMRVPEPADLRLQQSALTEFVLGSEGFRPREGARAIDVVVGHDAIRIEGALAYEPNGTYVVVRGEESEATAPEHATLDHAQRIAAAHELRIGGTIVRAHPGLGVVVPLPAPGALIECARNCAPLRVQVGGEPTTVTDPRSVLVPPPRDTSGIPTSADEPERDGNALPAPGAAAALAALAAALALGRRK